MAYNHRKIEEMFIDTLQTSRKAREALTEIQEEINFSLRSNINNLKELRVAGIMDEFTRVSYGPECQLIQLMPDRFMEQINEFKPDLIFIESAWNGYKNAWFRKVDRLSPEICALTAYCKSLSIPTVFWNKEDPVSLSGFMNTAGLCDYVFTTDVDAIGQYKMILGHNRVYHLHFAAQPLYHNPIEEYDRKDKISFAGAYYPRYPERMKVMDDFTHVFMEGIGMDIYDRNYHNPDSPYSFPEQYKPLIVGTLKPEEIGVAYKGYRYGLNMNSISQSQSMFARRVFELMASNTVVVGNYSRGVKNYFGDLTICTDSPETLRETLDCYCGSISNYEKYRLLALRKVLSEHLYEDRLDEIIKIVFGISLKTKLPKIYVLTDYKTQEEKNRIEKTLRRQSFPNWEVVPIQEGEQIEKKEDNSYYTFCSLQHYYGEHYLLDLVLSTRYAQKDGYVKGNKKKKPYTHISETLLEEAIVKNDCLAGKTFSSNMLVKGEFLITDALHFKADCLLDEYQEVEDLKALTQGLDMGALHVGEEMIRNRDTLDTGEYEVKDALQLYHEAGFSKVISGRVEDKQLVISSTLSPSATQYLFLESQYLIENYVNAGKILVHYQVKGELNVMGILWFFDQSNYRMGIETIPVNQQTAIDFPHKAKYFKLGFRLLGGGQAFVKSLNILKKKEMLFSRYHTQAPAIVMTNIYPAPNDLYRNMFVHRRMIGYREENLNLEVMCFKTDAPVSFREFEGIHIIEGGRDVFKAIALSQKKLTLCIHFLTQEMWEAMLPYLNRIHLIIWGHGADFHPWWRRMFNYRSDEEVEKAKNESDERQALWYDVFSKVKDYDIRFVFVSKTFYEEICEDYDFTFPENKVSIIHNLIDTTLYKYDTKKTEQRKKILSIRPYASHIYANDLTVKCIQELSKRPFFDDLEFRIIGDGPLYDETIEPLKGFENVVLERRFLTQSEIALLHKEYGIFMCPTRMDSQGVSRDEAMASGLVPATNAVAAIPEFVDESCGILAPAEDYMELANGIEKLYYDEELFSQMSYRAAMRVRNQSDATHTIGKEVELIKKVIQGGKTIGK